MKTAIYARYSTDKQNEASVDDQFRECERLAERYGFEVIERFHDAAISGGTTERPGYQAMLRAARQRAFDFIVAEDTSRLWRNLAEQAPRLAELADLGIAVVCHDLDTRLESAGILGAVGGAMAEQYRKEIGRRTRRGLEGRARKGASTGGRAYGYIAARDSGTGQREVHAEQADIVRRIFCEYADGKSPRMIAQCLNTDGVSSPGASWNRTSDRLNAKRRRGWVPTAIHGDRRRGTGILNNLIYTGELVWGRSVWKRSATDSKQRRWQPSEPGHVVQLHEERLRVVSQNLWDKVKARQQGIEHMTVTLRSALKRNGRLPRHVLSGLMVCDECGGTFRCVNGREYGCATHRDGGRAACSNDIRVPIELAERKLIGSITDEVLSADGVAYVERKVRELARARAQEPAPLPKSQAALLANKSTEIEQLRALMKAGTLSQAVAQVAIDKAEEELTNLGRPLPVRNQDSGKVIRMLPAAARALRERIAGGNAGLRKPASIVLARIALFELFGGKVPLRQAEPKLGEKRFLVARVGLNREVLLEAAATAAGCVKSGSGGRI